MCTVLEDEKECQSVCLPGACSLVGLNCSNLLRGTIDKYIYSRKSGRKKCYEAKLKQGKSV